MGDLESGSGKSCQTSSLLRKQIQFPGTGTLVFSYVLVRIKQRMTIVRHPLPCSRHSVALSRAAMVGVHQALMVVQQAVAPCPAGCG